MPAPGDPEAALAGNSGTEFAAGWRGAVRLLTGPLRMLVTGQALGQFADGLAQVSFAGFVLFDIGTGATPARIASVLAVTLLPFSVVGPVAGVLIDRWDRRRTLVVTSLCRAGIGVLAVGVVLARSEPLAFAVALVLLASSRFVLDAKAAALPATVAPADLVRANSVSALAGVSAAFLGAVAGSVIVAVAAGLGFVVAAAAYLAAAMAFGRLPSVGGGGIGTDLTASLGRLARALRTGLTEMRTHADIRRPLLAVWLHRALLGGGFALFVLVADSRYHLQTSGYTLAIAVAGVCTFAGSLVAPWLVGRWRAGALLTVAFLPPAAAITIAGYFPQLPALLGALAVTAASFQILKVVCDALLGRAVAERLRGRVFAVYDVLYNVAFVVAGLLMIPFWGPGHARAVLWWLAAGYVVGWLLFARATRSWPAAPGERAQRVPRVQAWAMRGAALAAGAVPVLAFPAPSLWWWAWVALVPWLALLRSAPTWRAAADRGWWAAAGFLLAVHYWLAPVTGPLLFVIAAFLGAFWVPWSLLTWWLLHGRVTAWRRVGALIAVPAGWVLIEAARSWSALGGPWGLLGTSQWNNPDTLASASLGGVWLVSLLIVTANVAVLEVLVSQATRERVGAIVCVVAVLAVGPAWYQAEAHPTGTGAVRLAVVQPGVITTSHRLAREMALTRSVPPGSVDLIVWGESSVGTDVFSHAPLRAMLVGLARREQADLMVNVDARTPQGAVEKVAVLIGPDGILGHYQKMRLVPFGEYIPLRPLFGWLAHFTKAAAVNRVGGSHLTVFRTSSGLRIGPLICFEIAFPDMSRNLVRDGARLIVYQSANSTFQHSWQPDQQAALASVRAVETGRPVVQAALSGTSAAFWPTGTRLAWFSNARRGVLTLAVPLTARSTPFVRYGDWVLEWAVLILSATVIAATLDAARSRPRPAEPTPADAAAASDGEGVSRARRPATAPPDSTRPPVGRPQ